MKLLLLFACLLSTIRFAAAGDLGSFELRAVADAPGTETQEVVLPARPSGTPEKLWLDPAVLLDATALRAAFLQVEQDLTPSIRVRLTNEGAKRFGEITTKYVGKRLAIIVDGKVRSATVVYQPILGGELQVSGNITPEEATDLVTRLSAAIPKSAP